MLLTDWPTGWLTIWLTDWLTDRLPDWLTEAVLRDFPEIWHVEQALGLRITIRFNDFYEDAVSKSEIPAPATRKALWTNFEPQKTSRDPGVLTLLTSESLLHAGVGQILAAWTSNSVPAPSVFNDFNFQTALARRRGANFGDVNFQKCSRALSF